jgi:hypothetical protein
MAGESGSQSLHGARREEQTVQQHDGDTVG